MDKLKHDLSVESFKHSSDKRVHIPSMEEAGYEQVNPKVTDKEKGVFPLNPVTKREQSPELYWVDKYGKDDNQENLVVDIRSLYRHEHVSPEVILNRFVGVRGVGIREQGLFSLNELFGNALEMDELEKVSEYYSHQDGWTNRLIQGDSLLVMTSLLEREGMAGKVQTIYIDPPYGIKYGSNWQMKLNNRDVKDGSDEHLTSEPEQIKAYRDTWELGIHSYLSYTRDRLLVARELMTESGSCFVQISDENVHLVRNLMDEVFGSENFVVIINVQKTGGLPGRYLTGTVDYILWYAKDKQKLKYRQLFLKREVGDPSLDRYDMLMFEDGTTRRMKPHEIRTGVIPEKSKRYQLGALYSDGDASYDQSFKFEGKIYKPRSGKHWSTHLKGMGRLAELNRIEIMGSVLRYRRFADDFSFIPVTDRWDAVQLGTQKLYIVQTSEKAIQRCLLMTTDPGDLVLDPTCGSGTTAFVAEQWGRRWITIDTSRIAINIAKTRLMTATFPFYVLRDQGKSSLYPDSCSLTPDIRQGFIYKTVPHITLKSLANDETPDEETLYDQPAVDNKKLRVTGPFTVETLQSEEPVLPDEIAKDKQKETADTKDMNFEEKVFVHLKSAGVKNGAKDEHAIFTRIDKLPSTYLHAEGYYPTESGEKKAYLFIGPKFGTVSKNYVNEAVKECRSRGDADWLLILGFSFESEIINQNITTNLGSFAVTKVRMNDDLLQEGLLKKDKKAASFVTIGEPDVGIQTLDFLYWKEGLLIPQRDLLDLTGFTNTKELSKLSKADLFFYSLLSKGSMDVWKQLETISATSKKTTKASNKKETITAIEPIDWMKVNFTTIYDKLQKNYPIDTAKKLQKFVLDLKKTIEPNLDSLADAYHFSINGKLSVFETRKFAQIEIKGLDIYDPIKDRVSSRDKQDIAYWMVDETYDGSNFIVSQVFFCGGDKSEYQKWEKGLKSMAAQSAKKNLERAMKIEIDEEAFERVYGHTSHPIEIKTVGQRIAVRVISQFGEESTRIVRNE
jgi:adenine-specific DNA-methyltransferase